MRATERLGRNLGLILYPIFFDLISIFAGLIVSGFSGASKFTIKLALSVGLPSITDVIDQNVAANGFSFSTGGMAGGAASAFLLFILFLAIGAFVRAGFAGLLNEAARDGRTSFEEFMDYGRRFWGRMLVIQLIVLLVALGGGIVMLGLLGGIGMIIYLIGFIVLRILYIYWEYTVVAEDCSVGEGFYRSRLHYGHRTSETGSIIVAIIGMNLIAGLVVNLLWSLPVLILAVPIYAYPATALQLALMASLHRILERGRDGEEPAPGGPGPAPRLPEGGNL